VQPERDGREAGAQQGSQRACADAPLSHETGIDRRGREP
jgi:hypothetical protein